MHETTLAFVWHMHQPYYRDMASGVCTMPWVRLHAIHSYYDMLRIYREFPQVRGTINFVPSLIEQLRAYVESDASDVFLDHARVPAEELTGQQKVFLLRHFFTANTERKIRPYSIYNKLLERLGGRRPDIDFDQAVRFFSAQDYLDIQVWHNLVWFGFAAREEIPELQQMLIEARHFTEEDKAFVLEAQTRIMRSVIRELEEAARSDNVELSTTPYYHPILPLVMDTDIAKRCMPKAHLPQRFSNVDSARQQLIRALDSMERWFGARPRGIWPAEGSVCPEMIPILAKAGVQWMATDDMVLKRSLPGVKTPEIHKPYAARLGESEIGIVFRDHGLSDLIGFTYSKMSADDAVEDFFKHIGAIAKGRSDSRKLVTVILDGENPWEFYPDSGREFLRKFFGKIASEGIPTTRVGDYIRTFPPDSRIDDLHSGSWINADFNIWIGKPQKNQAWDYIRRTANELGEDLSPAAAEGAASSAYSSFLAACGSDWFWWFDEDFDSAFKGDFDRIFRGHLKNAFAMLGRQPPLFLFEPIYRYEDTRGELIEPPGFIRPSIDATTSSFFEWANAARIPVHGRTSGAMAQSSVDPFEAISFGFNEKSFYLRIEPVEKDNAFSMADDEELALEIHGKSAVKRFIVSNRGGALAVSADDVEGKGTEQTPAVEFAAKNIVEMGFTYESLGLGVKEPVTLTLVLRRKGVEVRRYSHMRFVVPDKSYETRMWSA